MKYSLDVKNIFSWFFALLFILIGILNLVQVHPVPGIFYLVVAMFFLPPVNSLLLKSFGFQVPFFVKAILFVLIMWATLAVSDLAEIYGL